MTPDQNRAYTSAYDRWQPRILLICVLAPIIPLWPFWETLQRTLGIEGAAGLAVILQLGLCVLLPHRIADQIATHAANKRAG